MLQVSPRDVEWTACEASSSNVWQDQPPTFYAAFSTQHNRIFKLRRDQSIPITLKGESLIQAEPQHLFEWRGDDMWIQFLQEFLRHVRGNWRNWLWWLNVLLHSEIAKCCLCQYGQYGRLILTVKNRLLHTFSPSYTVKGEYQIWPD